MKRKHRFAAVAALSACPVALMGATATVATSAAAPAAATAAARSVVAAQAGPTVTVRIEGASGTLLPTTTVHTQAGFLTNYGAPQGACPASSAAGALQVATRGQWSGSWSSSYKDYFITTILGDTESGSTSYWDILVNHIAASTGACGIQLHGGDRLLFAAVSTTAKGYPLAVQLLSKPVVNRPFRVRVVFYDAKGVPRPLAGATVTAQDKSAPTRVKSHVTNTRGVATLTESKLGRIELGARDSGYVRAATVQARVVQHT
jgi:hypothetical protein